MSDIQVETTETASLIGQRKVRLEKTEKLRSLGINPYPSKSLRDTKNIEIIEKYEEYENKEVTVAGRIMTWRDHGHLVFIDLQDPTGRVQIYIKEEELNDTSSETQTIGFKDLGLLDVGDIIEVRGTVTKTKRGEISVLPQSLRILTKAIRPLPEKHAGLKDQETIFRQRYLDTIMNPDHKDRFAKRAKIVFAIREFLNQKGFLEIKTPMIQPVYGGGMAKPFMTHVNALDENYFLAIAHELYLKRLITAGFENVYNIVGYFRNEGIDRSHHPEFEMLETMTAYKNYEYNMNLIEEMYKYVVSKVFGRYTFMVRGQEVNFNQEWRRLKMIDAVKEYAGYDFDTVKSLEEGHKILDEIGYEKGYPDTVSECMLAVFQSKVEDQLIQPVFITGHPVEISPLAKRMEEDSRFVERFEIFIGGIEQGDNWTELNDPVELYERFKDQQHRRAEGNDEAHPMDIEFIECMEQGMPPTTGLGPGIERMIMTLTETDYIDDVIFFPMLKPAPITQQQKEIYGQQYLVKNEGSHTEAQDFSKKIVIVLNEDLEGWKVTNTVAHIAGYIGSKIKYENYVSTDSFTTKDGQEVLANSQYAIVAVKAKQSQIINLLKRVEEKGLVHLAYTQDMINTTNDEELSASISQQNKDDLNYLGVGIFGTIEEVDKLTKKFSLWK